MKKKWLKIMVIGASIGLTSSHAGAIDLASLGSAIGIGDGLASALCPTTPNAADPTAAGTPEAGNFFCQLQQWTTVANNAKETYEKTQKIVNGLTGWQYATIAATIATQPGGLKKVTDAFGKITNAGSTKDAVAAAGDASTLLENLSKGKTATDKTDIEKKVEQIQKDIAKYQTIISGASTATSALSGGLPANQASAQKVKDAATAYGTVFTVAKAAINGTTVDTAKQITANTTVVTVAEKVATTEIEVNGDNSAKNMTNAAKIAATRIKESNNAVSTRAAIQVTNKLLADALTLQADQSANLTSTLQKQASLQAMTVQQMGTMISTQLNKINQEQSDASTKLDEIQTTANLSFTLLQAQLTKAVQDLPTTSTVNNPSTPITTPVLTAAVSKTTGP
jgi:hypothetical protein